MLSPYNIAISLTYQCPIECRSCMVDCGPSRQGELSVNQIKRYIDMAAQVESIRVVTYTGGEPFLVLPTLREAIHYAKSVHNLWSGLITNAFWAISYTRAYGLLQDLQARGLISLCASADKFHQEYIPLDCVINAVMAARHLGLTCSIRHTYTCTESTQDLVEKLVAGGLPRGEMEICSQKGPMVVANKPKPQRIKIENQPCWPEGRAKRMVPTNDLVWRKLRLSDEGLNQICGSVFMLISIDYDGSISLCCGGDAHVPPLIIGNVRDISLKQAVEQAQYHPLLNAVSAHGIKPLLQALLQAHLPLPTRYIDMCQLCRQLLSDPQCWEVLNQHLQNNMVKYLADRVLFVNPMRCQLKCMSSVIKLSSVPIKIFKDLLRCAYTSLWSQSLGRSDPPSLTASQIYVKIFSALDII